MSEDATPFRNRVLWRSRTRTTIAISSTTTRRKPVAKALAGWTDQADCDVWRAGRKRPPLDDHGRGVLEYRPEHIDAHPSPGPILSTGHRRRGTPRFRGCEYPR